jgi:hypothetical protein
MSDNMAIAADFERVLQTGDMAAMGELTLKWAADDFIQVWPQSGERLTKDGMSRLGTEYATQSGTAPKFTYKRMIGGGDVFVVEGTIDYGDGIPVSYVGVGELRDGKIAKITEYFANPFPAPEWRKPFVEA